MVWRPSSSRSLGRLARRLRFEEAVGRPRQAEVLAQGGAFVFAAEEAAPLQLRHDLVDEVVQALRAGRGT